MIRHILPAALCAVLGLCLVAPASLRAQDTAAKTHGGLDGTGAADTSDVEADTMTDDGTGVGDATDPTATDPTATDPTATDPTATDATATEPSATDPSATDPSATNPSATNPSATDPAAIDPSVATDPATTPAPAPTTAAPTRATKATTAPAHPKKRPVFLANGFPDVRGVGKFENGFPLLGGFKLGPDGMPTELTDGKTTIHFVGGKPVFKTKKHGRPVVPGVVWVGGKPYFAGTKIFLVGDAGKLVGCAPAVIFERRGLPAGFTRIAPPRTSDEIEAEAAAKRTAREARVRATETELAQLESLVPGASQDQESLRALEQQITAMKRRLRWAKARVAHVAVETRFARATASMTRTIERFLVVEAQIKAAKSAAPKAPVTTSTGGVAAPSAAASAPAKTKAAKAPKAKKPRKASRHPRKRLGSTKPNKGR